MSLPTDCIRTNGHLSRMAEPQTISETCVGITPIDMIVVLSTQRHTSARLTHARENCSVIASLDPAEPVGRQPPNSQPVSGPDPPPSALPRPLQPGPAPPWGTSARSALSRSVSARPSARTVAADTSANTRPSRRVPAPVSLQHTSRHTLSADLSTSGRPSSPGSLDPPSGHQGGDGQPRTSRLASG